MNHDFNINIYCEWKKTRNGFMHIAELYDGQYLIAAAKVHYINRTWESYPYQTAISSACCEWIERCERRIFDNARANLNLTRLSKDRKNQLLQQAGQDDEEYKRAVLLRNEIRHHDEARQYIRERAWI